ncbi:MAG: hypothetical protein A2W52_02410 [Candidatus Taylorbacteria bacterium RIFCSPHIGHO2_02_49_25]|uniref:ribonucleoside-triphosphate reductase (thioredoxin) n=1 Tax=Candidatus Taylorbacteria bacterium RIFCSPHIGHO2_02_49_25 TaxID=1802305 RepID=A0A1G2MJQ9_9BACT|nr:MAG: Ribonucleoside-triphosphate reductase [Parcubacteria group bacterium GW2011_GWF2_50_9]OHA19279.1 MAG: hypothetical protein A2759_03220 [Candidatus Taylorbacteria bacterium RIFCSPHIGHO2_01_FULL_49_60]OHA23251.1 MAG: hypothetical protein A2W52_02410 [Candidatus Taylorbacteria bacterium RIFCSPHIGHO2_02_49_25]OHA35561.1 MAG: hypothetical protein A2W65_00690 [Candidatus Taylorbacteria bacterium RIFCSPLOWO2_02_50_13]OHA37044.1 MAG: hypothetical protein A3B27_01735 [Candidatus Taylorbacteria b
MNNAPTNVDTQAISEVRKRDGRIVPFDMTRIEQAISRAFKAVEEGSEKDAARIASLASDELVRLKGLSRDPRFLPSIELIQDTVEQVLMREEFGRTAKAYILYRQKRAELRENRGIVSKEIRELAEASKQYFKNSLGEFIYYRSYSRWMPEKGRRETWIETVNRFMGFMREMLGGKLDENTYTELREGILKHEAMPSMRLLQFAGTPAKTTNVCAYNCSYIAPERFQDLAEIMYISMCGGGAGWSVESQNVGKFPQIAMQTGKKFPSYRVLDSKEGWCDALSFALSTYASGADVDFDFSAIRPAGTRLKTMGGRASGPGPLQKLLSFARERILKRQGKRLTNLDVHDIICMIGDCVVAGGVRRSAMISLSDLDDETLRDAKKGAFYVTEPQRMLANNSAVYREKPTSAEFMREWLALMESGSGERGIFNRGILTKILPKRRLAALREERGYFDESGETLIGPIGTNPCVTGDTLVYVADGRGHVPIQQLAGEGKDIPVFCLDGRGRIVVRYMRHPRVTGYRQPIYALTLDDGSVVRTTANHKFRLRNGAYREVRDLKHGDSLFIITKYEASIKDIFPTANSNSQNYWWVNRGGLVGNDAEHRLIASFHYNTTIPKSYVVHHKDRNAENNAPGNLKILSKVDHDALHTDFMAGDKNPMRRAAYEWSDEKWAEYKLKHSNNNKGERNKNFSGVTDNELQHHAMKLTRLTGGRFSNRNWIEYAKANNLPQSFCKWRRDHLGGVLGLAKWAALELSFENIDADPRIAASYKKYTALGYDCEITNNQFFIMKCCEVCSKIFRTTISTRECGICSISCGLAKKWTDTDFRKKTLLKIKATHDSYRGEMREKQAEVYSDLVFNLGRAPLKEEWKRACRQRGISFEISRSSSPFLSYADLKEAASRVNHKVVSVSLVGYEDVYNGTVDEFHNFFVGGFAGVTRNGKRKFVYLNNPQCGEIILQSKQFCNLTEIVARPEDTKESLRRKVRLATILGTFQSTLTYFPYLSAEWKEHCERERLLGVSITGQWDSPRVRTPEVLNALREEAITVNTEFAAKFGINPSTAITCVKPSGTLSQMVDSSSGMHPRHAPYYIRRIRISATDSLFKMLKDQGVPNFPEVGQTREDANTFVLEFPVTAPLHSVFKNDVSALEQLEHWKIVRNCYTEHNPSVTISVGENEWIAVADWLYKNWNIVCGLSFLPRDNHVYRLAPYEEIDEAKYETLRKHWEHVDFSKIMAYEKADEQDLKRELACAGGVCEI